MYLSTAPNTSSGYDLSMISIFPPYLALHIDPSLGLLILLQEVRQDFESLILDLDTPSLPIPNTSSFYASHLIYNLQWDNLTFVICIISLFQLFQKFELLDPHCSIFHCVDYIRFRPRHVPGRPYPDFIIDLFVAKSKPYMK